MFSGVGRLGLRAVFGGPSYSVLSLFANGEQGVWYQNSDFSTLFQDAAGGTPVTGLEQPVGLRLDKRVPIGQAGYNSVYFDGTNDYLTAGANSGALGSGDFTIETWSFLTARVNDYPCIWSNYSSFAAGSLALFAGHASATTTRYQLAINGAGFPNIQSSISVAYNQWVHLAVVRRSGVITLYVNGVADGTFSTSANLSGTTGSSWIGAAGDALTSSEIQGSLSNLRVVVGTAVYTGNFTPPKAPLTAIAGTALLTCQNTTISDNGPNAVSITAFGETKTTLTNPFGNNAFQTTNSARPVLSARYNLLTQTEAFENAVWDGVAGEVTVTPNAINSPIGTLTADFVVPNTNNTAHRRIQPLTLSAGLYTFSCSLKAGGYSKVVLFLNGPNQGVVCDLSASTASAFTKYAVAPSNISLVSLGSGWYSASFTTNVSSAVTYAQIQVYNDATSPDATYSGNGTSGVYLWGADLRAASESPALPAYQRVGAATYGTSTVAGNPDYDTVGFPPYLIYDGGDWFQTNSINFSTGATNPPLGPELSISGWINFVGTFETLTTSGSTITSAINSVSSGYCYTPKLNMVSGKWYRLSILLTLNSGTGPFISTGNNGSSNNLGSLLNTRLVNGVNTILFQFNGDTNDYFWLYADVAANFSMTIQAYELASANYAPDKMSVFAGVRKLADVSGSGFATIAELSSDAGVNNGVFGVYGSNTFASPPSFYQFNSKGTVEAVANVQDGPYAAPVTNVLSGLGNISGDSCIIRLNSIVLETTTSDQGSGTFGNYPIYFGSRNGSTSFFTGRDYGFVIVGRAVTASELTNTEDYMDVQTFGKNMTLVYSDELTTALGELITAADGDQIYMTVQYV